MVNENFPAFFIHFADFFQEKKKRQTGMEILPSREEPERSEA